MTVSYKNNWEYFLSIRMQVFMIRFPLQTFFLLCVAAAFLSSDSKVLNTH